MDHTLSLPEIAPVVSRPAPAGPAATPSPSDEEPESPGRSPGSRPAPSPLSDPLSDGLAMLAGVAIALLTVLVPLMAVVSEPRPLEPLRSSSLETR
jgi:hypothetical protein